MADSQPTPLIGLPNPSKPLVIGPRGPLIKVSRVKWERDQAITDLIDYFEEPRFHDKKIKSDAERFELLTLKELKTIQSIAEKCRLDFSYAARNFFWITTKKRGDKLFTLWESQQLIYEHLLSLKSKGLPMKMQILKARQLGSSTVVEGLIAWRTMFFRNVNSIVVSYDPDHAAYLFGIMQHIYDMMVWWLKPQCSSREYKDGLRFDNPDYEDRRKNPGLNSQVTVQAANKRTGVGTGTRINAGHLSEYSLWNQDYAVDVIEKDLGNALAEDDPEMFAILESTAQGTGNYSYRLWKKNVELAEQAEWHPLFLPWFFESSRVLAPPGGWRPEEPERNMQERISKDWLRCNNEDCKQYHERYKRTQDLELTTCDTCKAGILESYQLTRGQMFWMQRKRKNAEKDSESLKTLKQEQCSTAIEAFQVSGIQVFSEAAQEWANNCIAPPIKEGFIDKAGKFHGCDPKNIRRNPQNNEYYEGCYLESCNADHSYGDAHGEKPLRIWGEPEEGGVYVIGADVAEGLGGDADNSVGCVLKISTNGGVDEQVAVWRSNTTDPIAFAHVLNYLGRWYNDAMMSIEVNRYDTTMSTIRFQLQYPNLYRWKHLDSLQILSNKLGWFTQSNSKPRLYQTFHRALLQKILIIRSENLCEEMKTFIKDDYQERAAGSERGSYDDECFPSGTLIQTNTGVKPIEEIKIGDMVLTHKGRYMPVEATGVRHEQNELRKITAFGRPDLMATDNHPLYVWERRMQTRASGRMEKPDNPSGRKRRADFIGSFQVCRVDYREPEFRQVKDIPVTLGRKCFATGSVASKEIIDVETIDMAKYLPAGYRIAEDGELIGFTSGRIVHTMKWMPRHVPVDKDFLTMIGYYLAEGGRGTASVSFASHRREKVFRDWLIVYLRKLGLGPGEYESSENGSILFCSSMVLRSFFANFLQLEHKTLPQWVLSLPSEKQKHVIRGYLYGDGSFRNTYQIKASTVSPQIGYQIFLMSLRCGWQLSMRERKGQNGHRKQWAMSWSAESAKEIIEGADMLECKRSIVSVPELRHSPLRYKDGYLIGKIKSIKKVPFFGPVYNISVAEDHSYTANGTIVSNCMATMIALYCAHEGDWDDSMDQINFNKRQLSLEEAPWIMECYGCKLVWPAHSNKDDRQCPRCKTMQIGGTMNRSQGGDEKQGRVFGEDGRLIDGDISKEEAQEYSVSTSPTDNSAPEPEYESL